MADQTKRVPDDSQWEDISPADLPNGPQASRNSIPPPPSSGNGETWTQWGLRQAKDIATAPETVASLIPGIGTLGAGAIGAGTSIAKDIYNGETRPSQIGLHAIEHGGLSMIPGGLGTAAERGVGGAVMHGIASIKGLPGLLGKMGIMIDTLGPAAEKGAAGAVGGVVDDLASAQFADGLKVVSSEGLKRLVKQAVDYENSPEMNKVVLKKLEDYIHQVEQRLGASSTMEALQKAGIEITTVAQQKAKAVAQAAKDRVDAWTKLGRYTSPLLGAQLPPHVGDIDLPAPPSSKP